MIVSLFPDEQKQEACSPFFVDAFMKGSAVLSAAAKHPTTLEDAYKYVQDAMQLCKAILGKKASVRKIKYVESDMYSSSTDTDSSSTTSEEGFAKTFQARSHGSRRDKHQRKDKVHHVIYGLHYCILYLYSAQYLHILQDSKHYQPTAQV